MTTNQTPAPATATPARTLFRAPGISLAFTPTEDELTTMGLPAGTQTVELFGIEFSRA